MRAVVFFAAGLRAVVFFAAGLRAVVFFAAGLRAVVFLAAGFFAAGLRAVAFFAAGLRAAVFLAAGFRAPVPLDVAIRSSRARCPGMPPGWVRYRRANPMRKRGRRARVRCAGGFPCRAVRICHRAVPMRGYPTSASDRALALGARAILGLPPHALRRIAGRPVIRDGQTLDLQAQALLRLIEVVGEPPLPELTPLAGRAAIRREAASVAGRPLPLAEVRETTVRGADGSLAARLFVPHECAQDDASPALVYFHGGGWVVGDCDSHDAPCRMLARTAGVRVLSVDYRLAPEHPYPAAADDAYAAFQDVRAHAERYGVDPARIAVGGDSAGGNVSAACAQRAVREGEAPPAFQLLIYPVTDNSRQDTASYGLFGDGFFLTAADMRWYRGHYFGADRTPSMLEPTASPLLARDLTGLPPAHVVTAGFDPLRDEGEAYAAAMRAAGVAVTARRHPGLIHGFVNAIGAARSPRDAVAEMGGVLRAGLAA